MQERLAAEHASELLVHALEHFLNGGGVPYKSRTVLESFDRDVAYSGLDVVGDPFDCGRGSRGVESVRRGVCHAGAHPSNRMWKVAVRGASRAASAARLRAPKYAEFLFCTWSIASSTSFSPSLPRKIVVPVR